MKKYFLILFLCLLLLPVVNAALSFDNVKSYDKLNKEYTIKNSFGLGKTLAKVKLTSPLNVEVGLGYQQVAEFELYNFDKEYDNAFQKMDFYNAVNLDIKLNREFDYKYATYELRKVYTHETVCGDEKDWLTCKLVVNGSIMENKSTWKSFNSIEELPYNKVKIGIFTDVEEGDYVEWIPTFFGERLTEWATWTASLNVGLQAYYKLDEASGPVVDSSPRESHGTNVDGTRSATGIINDAFDFNDVPASDEFVRVPKMNVTQNFTVNAWINPETLTRNNPVMGCNYSDDWSFFLWFDSGELAIYKCGDAGVQSSTAVGVGGFEMVSAVYNGSFIDFYINGTLKQTMAFSETFTPGITRNIGAYGGGDSYDGIIDEVSVWNRTLTPTEMTALWNSGAGMSYETPGTLNETNITLNIPINTTNSTTGTITFNCSATYSKALDLVIDGVADTTQIVTNSTPNANLSYQFTDYGTLSDGQHNWTCVSTNVTDGQIYADNFTLNIDATLPTISITNPTGNYDYGYSNQNITLNFTAADDNLNSCWYYYLGGESTTREVNSFESNWNNWIDETANRETIWASDGVYSFNISDDASKVYKHNVDLTGTSEIKIDYNVNATSHQMAFFIIPNGTVSQNTNLASFSGANVTGTKTIDTSDYTGVWTLLFDKLPCFGCSNKYNNHTYIDNIQFLGVNKTEINCSEPAYFNLTANAGNILFYANDTFGNIGSTTSSWNYTDFNCLDFGESGCISYFNFTEGIQPVCGVTSGSLDTNYIYTSTGETQDTISCTLDGYEPFSQLFNVTDGNKTFTLTKTSLVLYFEAFNGSLLSTNGYWTNGTYTENFTSTNLSVNLSDMGEGKIKIYFASENESTIYNQF